MAQKKSQADNQDPGIKKPESRKENIQEVMPMSKRRALVVGINDYQGTWNDLPSSVKDAESFKDFLNHNLGFTEIKILTDRQATLTNVVSGLDWLLEDANPQDRLVFYYSGHGTTRPNSNIMQEYLSLYDDLLEDEEIIRRTRDLPQGVFTSIIDCCFSGGIEKRRYEAVARGFSESTSGTVTLERAKVKTYVSDPQQLLALEEAEKKATFYKPFGQPARLTPSGYSKSAASAANPKLDQTNQTLINGTLLASCIHDETAVADTKETNGLSAFTYSLLKVCEQHGLSMNLGEMMSLITMELRMLGLRQTPRVKVSSEALLSRCLMNLGNAYFTPQFSGEHLNEQGLVNSIVNEVLNNLQMMEPQRSFSTNTPNTTNQWRETMYTQFENPLYNNMYNMIPNQLEANREFIRRNYMQPSYNTMPGAYYPFPQHQMHFGHQFPMHQPPFFGQHFPQWREPQSYGHFPQMMHQPPSFCAQSCERIGQYVTMSLPFEYRQQFAPIIWNVLPLISERISSLLQRSQQFGVLPYERHQIELIIANTLTSVFHVIVREQERRFSMGQLHNQIWSELPVMNIISTILPVILETIEREKVRLHQQGLAFTPEIVTTISQQVILQLQNLLPLNILQTVVPQIVEAIVRSNWASVGHTSHVPNSQTTSLRNPQAALV